MAQIVWCKTHYLSNAAGKFNAKLAPKFDGSWKVHSFLSPVKAIIKEPKNKKTKLTIHLTIVEIQNLRIIRAIFCSFHETTWTNSDKRREVSAQQREASEGQEDGKADTRPASG